MLSRPSRLRGQQEVIEVSVILSRGDVEHEREVNKTYLELLVSRLGHVETLLLGLATVGLAGWGFLHVHDPGSSAGPATGSTSATVGNPGRVLFAVVFSGLIASAYSMLYLARMALNVTLLKLEGALQTKFKPYSQYFLNVGPNRSRVIYYCTAVFLPIMSLGSLVYTLIQDLVHLDGLQAGILGALWTLSLVAVVGTTALSVLYIEKAVAEMRVDALASTTGPSSAGVEPTPGADRGHHSAGPRGGRRG